MEAKIAKNKLRHQAEQAMTAELKAGVVRLAPIRLIEGSRGLIEKTQKNRTLLTLWLQIPISTLKVITLVEVVPSISLALSRTRVHWLESFPFGRTVRITFTAGKRTGRG